MSANDFFSHLARATARKMGHPGTFVLAIVIIFLWAVSGPMFGWSDTWQLVINTGTTIITFLMVFLIQNTQNRDSEALQLKIDELIRATKRARNDLINLEECSEEELQRLKEEFAKLTAKQQATHEMVAKTHSQHVANHDAKPAHEHGPKKPGSSAA